MKEQLINYFRKNKKDLLEPFKELKKDILSKKDRELEIEYKVHIEELRFYGLIKK
jgi:hypothetical protein